MSRLVKAGNPSKRTKFPGASYGERLNAHSSGSTKAEKTSHFIVALGMMYIHTE